MATEQLAHAKAHTGTCPGCHDDSVRIGVAAAETRHFDFGIEAADRALHLMPVLFAVSRRRRRQVQAAACDVSARQSTKTDARTIASAEEGVEERAARRSPRSYKRVRERARARATAERDVGERRGGDLPGRDVSLTHSVSLTQTDVHHGQAGS